MKQNTPQPPRGDDFGGIPLNQEAEESVIGACMLSSGTLNGVLEKVRLEPQDFADPRARNVFTVIRDLHAKNKPVDAVTVAHRLKTLSPKDEMRPYLATVIDGVPSPSSGIVYAEIVRDLSAKRQLLDVGDMLRKGAFSADPGEALRFARDAIAGAQERFAPASNGHRRPVELAVFLSHPGPDYDWLIEGVLERRERLILTAREGDGKSTLLMQLAVQCAAGIHPFADVEMGPLRVLVVDLENSEQEIRRRLRPLSISAKGRLKADQLFILPVPEGLDVPKEAEDRRILESALETCKPDLLILGPLYKLSDASPTEEKEAKPVALYLDELRVRFGFAVLIEAHIPHDAKGRPYGWSGWRRWPEIGIELKGSGVLAPWRVSRHQTPLLPKALDRGGTWPFMPSSRTVQDTDLPDQRPSVVRVRNALKSLGEPAGWMQIGDQLAQDEHPLKKRTIFKALEDLREEGLADNDEQGRWSLLDGQSGDQK